MAGPNWGDLSQPGPKSAPQESPDARRFAELSAQLFATGAGKEWLDLLRKRTIEKRSRPRGSDAELREDEAQRALVHEIEIARDKGRDLPAKAKPAAA